MILKARGQIAEHGIDLGGQGHEVSRIGWGDLLKTPIEVIQGDVHVQRRTDIQADGQPMQLAHHDIFQAAADQLFARPKHLGADKAGHIVEVNPGALGIPIGSARLSHLPRELSRETVLARLVQDHVKTVVVTVGEVGTLARFKIQTKATLPSPRVVDHLVDRQIEGRIGCVIARDTLEPQFGRSWLLFFGCDLDIDVR